MRAAFVSVNLFLLLCSGDHMATSSAQGSIMHYGGPILYLIGQSLFFFALLIRRESGPLFRRTSRKPTGQHLPDSEFTSQANGRMKKDVAAEAQRVAGSDNALQVMKVTKSFNGDAVVKDVSFGVEEGSTLALLGPNGAGQYWVNACSFPS
jgi:ATP-binding cassette subfamily A (ABC1) protein 3